MPVADSIECPHCTARIRIKSEAVLGKKVSCPKCSEPFVAKAVTEGPTKLAKTAATSATRSTADSTELVAISCPHCDAKFRLKSTALGKKRSCPKCDEEFTPRAASAATKSRTSKAKNAQDEPDDDDFLKSLSAAARDSQSAEAEEEPEDDESEELAPRKSRTSGGKKKKKSNSSSGGGFSVSGLFGWVIGGTIGAAIWVAVGYFSGFEVGWIAWGVGVLSGMGVAAVASANGEADSSSGITAAVISILAVLAGKYAVVHLVIDQAMKQIPAGAPEAQQMQQMQQQVKQAVFLGSFGPIDILWFFLAAGSAYKLGSGQQEGD